MKQYHRWVGVGESEQGGSVMEEVEKGSLISKQCCSVDDCNLT